MIDFISSWARGIIVAVIVASIFEMILPNGKNKKYIKVIIGIYILFNVVSPVIGQIYDTSKSTIDVSKFLSLDTYINSVNDSNKINDNLNISNEESIKNLYITKLESDIKSKIKDLGFQVQNIKVQLENNEEYTVKRLDIKVTKLNEQNENTETTDDKNIINIEPIKEINISISGDEQKEEIGNFNNKSMITDSEKEKIKIFLNDTYNIKIQNIFIN